MQQVAVCQTPRGLTRWSIAHQALKSSSGANSPRSCQRIGDLPTQLMGISIGKKDGKAGFKRFWALSMINHRIFGHPFFRPKFVDVFCFHESCCWRWTAGSLTNDQIPTVVDWCMGMSIILIVHVLNSSPCRNCMNPPCFFFFFREHPNTEVHASRPCGRCRRGSHLPALWDADEVHGAWPRIRDILRSGQKGASYGAFWGTHIP